MAESDADRDEKHRRALRRGAIAGALALVLCAPLASGAVRAKLAGAWRGFLDPASTEAQAPRSGEVGPADVEPGGSEQPEIEGDFSLFDADATEAYGVAGVVTSLSDLSIPMTQRTMRYVEYFGQDADGRESFYARLRRAGRYREHIEESLRYAGLPEDLLWLAAIESGFVPQATSGKGAVGLFQFMPETAQRFGLAIDSEIDERRSITRSTEAAILYLSFLHEKFGAWDLALAAYNCGEGRLDTAIGKARERLGLQDDDAVEFHELAQLKLLPKETSDFVPKIHAFAIVAHNAEALALDDLDPLPSMRFAQIAVPGGTRLSTIAAAADLSIAAIRDLNPDLLTDRMPGSKGDVLINVPPDLLAQTLAALPSYLVKEATAVAASEPEPSKTPGSKEKRIASKKSKGATKAGREVPTHGDEVARADGKPHPKSSSSRPEKVVLKPAPLRPGAFLLASGVIVEIKKEDRPDVALGARVEVLDPLKNRGSLGASFKLDERTTPSASLPTALSDEKKALRDLVLGAPASKLREHLATRRAPMHEKLATSGPFAALSEIVYPKGSPMAGALLVGPTEPADDMFLEPEPTWALDTVVTIRGPVDPDALASDLETAFADTFVPLKAATLAKATRTRVGKGERRVLVGWSSPPPRASNETALDMAFMLACHNRLGRFHRALRLDKAIAGRLNCSLETAPFESVAWVFATPNAPYSIADAEREIDASVTSLTTEGPTDQELAAVRGLLRAELARERDTATMRGMPKSWVVAHNDAILSGMDQVTKAEVIDAAKILFAKDRRIVVLSD